MQIWAHRGARTLAPENTIEAFKKAIELGADGIELDVQMTADGKLVVIHDETLHRVSDGEGFVKDHTLARLKELNFNQTMPEYPSQQIPTLREVLQLLKPTNLMLNIELKNGLVCYDGMEEKVVALVEYYGMQDRVWYSSFNHASVLKLKHLCPKAKCGLIYTDGLYEPWEYAKRLGIDALHPATHNLSYPQLAEKCRENNIALHPWKINNANDFEMCVSVGAEAFITDYPAKARIYMQPLENGHYVFENPFEIHPQQTYCLFGAGILGQYFLKKHIAMPKPLFIVDNEKTKQGKRMDGIEIKSPDELKETDVVIVASVHYPEMIEQLKSLGVKNYYIHDRQTRW